MGEWEKRKREKREGGGKEGRERVGEEKNLIGVRPSRRNNARRNASRGWRTEERRGTAAEKAKEKRSRRCRKIALLLQSSSVCKP